MSTLGSGHYLLPEWGYKLYCTTIPIFSFSPPHMPSYWIAANKKKKKWRMNAVLSLLLSFWQRGKLITNICSMPDVRAKNWCSTQTKMKEKKKNNQHHNTTMLRAFYEHFTFCDIFFESLSFQLHGRQDKQRQRCKTKWICM